MTFTQELLNYTPDTAELNLYPSSIKIGRNEFGCTYRFRPDGEDDGVTITIPASRAAALPVEKLDWLVPGLLREKVDALIRGLPKNYRKKLVPVTHTVDLVVAEMSQGKTSLATSLSQFLHKRLGVDIPAAAWPTVTLPEHLKAKIEITNASGKRIATSRDPAILQQKNAVGAPGDRLARLRTAWEQAQITPQTFPDLPETLETALPGTDPWVVFPALVSEGEHVALRLLPDANQAQAAHLQAVRQLFRDHFSKDLKFLRRKLLLPEYLAPAARYFGGSRALEKQIEDKLTKDLFTRNIRTAAAFKDHAEAVSARIINCGDELVATVKRVIEAYRDAYTAIDELRIKSFANGPAAGLLTTLAAELPKLVPENFVSLYEPERLPHLVRYVRALAIRAQRAMDAPEKDQKKATQIDRHVSRLRELLKGFTDATSGEKRSAVEKYFWLIEEYKVSQYAQELKTVEKVSPQRLNRLYADILRMT